MWHIGTHPAPSLVAHQLSQSPTTMSSKTPDDAQLDWNLHLRVPFATEVIVLCLHYLLYQLKCLICGSITAAPKVLPW